MSLPPPRHLTPLALDALATGSLPERERGPAASHLDSCDRCRSDLAENQEARAHFAKETFGRTLPGIQRGRTRHQWKLLGLGSLALVPALGAMLLLALPLAPVADLGIKGTATLRIFDRRGETVAPVSSGETLRAGDQLRFEVQPDGLPYLLIASVDGAGVASLYLPFDGSESLSIGENRSFLSPESVVLDAAPGPERVFALLSRQPIEAAVVKEALEALGKRGAAAIRGARSLPLPADVQLSSYWEKGTP